MKIALIRGPYLRPNGAVPWEELHDIEGYDVVGFTSNPARFDTDILDFPVRELSWWDGKLDAFGHDYVISKGLRRLHLPSNYLRGVSKLTSEFDVIHTSENFNLFSFQAALATLNSETKFVFAQGENIPYPLFQRNLFLWKMKQFVNRRAEGMTATTPKGKRALIHEGVSAEKVTVIPNSVNSELFKPTDPPNPSELGLPEELLDTLNVVFVHGLNQQKGTPYLLDAFEKVRTDHDDLRLILLGKNFLDDERTEHVNSCDQIVWEEHVEYDNMSDLYNLCDLAVLPSVTMPNNQEQFGMAILEAMACGLPTVVTDVGGLPYVTEQNTTSLVVEERNVEALADAINRLVESPDLREELGRNGLDRARTVFDRTAIAEDLADFYDSLMQTT